MATIRASDYRIVEKQEDGSSVYVRYIGDTPTLETIEISANKTSTKRSGVRYNSGNWNGGTKDI